LTALGDVPLHPLLAPRRAATAQSSSPSSTASISPRRVTLLDCVPVDKERALLAACTETHTNILSHIAQTNAAWAEISAGVAAQQQAALPPLAAAVVQGMTGYWTSQCSSYCMLCSVCQTFSMCTRILQDSLVPASTVRTVSM
jgi:hypothetical protein